MATMRADAPNEGTATGPPPLQTRITRMLGIDHPIVQAPMGFIARSPLASAVSNAGGIGIIETSSGELRAIREEVRRMRDLTSRPFGVNVAQAFLRDPSMIDFLVEHGVRFVTTSAGSPFTYTTQLKDGGVTVFHVVPTLNAALKAVDAGVDGLIVEGGEGGGFKSPRPASTMVLLPLVAAKVTVPLIAAGGIADGAGMAAAFALGADGIQMGTRMVASTESPVHSNWKHAIVAAAETDTVLLDRHSSPSIRALRTTLATDLEFDTSRRAMDVLLERPRDLYFGGDMEASLASTGEIAGRIDAVLSVQAIIEQCVQHCAEILQNLAATHLTVPR